MSSSPVSRSTHRTRSIRSSCPVRPSLRLSLALRPSMPSQCSRHSPLIELKRTLIVALQAGILVALDQVEVAHRERIELGPHEAAESILRSVDDRLAANIEAGIDQHGTAGLGLEAGEQRVKTRIALGMDGLDAG